MADRRWWRAWLTHHLDYRCPTCGLPIHPTDDDWDIDHTVPRIHGGPLGRDNQRPVHATCNRSAGASLGAARTKRIRPWP